MNKEEAIRFAGLMEDYLNIPSFVCEMIQQQLEENKILKELNVCVGCKDLYKYTPEKGFRLVGDDNG